MTKKFDFSGYATKNDLKCSDGRKIRKDAFKVNDGQTVPLVWQHIHNDPSNVLGHALLENREDGVYTFCTFNDTEAGKNTKKLVEHGDITALSIYANQLLQKGTDVLHGVIREVSLVLAGANSGALIDNLSIQHEDGSIDEDATEAIIYTGETFSRETVQHEDKPAAADKTIQEVFDSFSEEQKLVVYAMIGSALEEPGVGQSEEEDPEDLKHSEKKGGKEMKKNVFDDRDKEGQRGAVLSHTEIQAIITEAQKCGSFKEAFIAHTASLGYGIDDIDLLFPDAKTITNSPDFISRRMEWVQGVLSGTRHSPFSRIKSLAADITADEARAKGYVKGAKKTEEVIKLLRRITTPTTVYKKQKLDRDDIIDITDLDVVAWLKAEMRMMLDEELARAVLVGDGRDLEIMGQPNPDKINEEHLRPIYTDDDMYSHHVAIPADADTTEIIEAILRARTNYKGSGSPTLYINTEVLTDMILLKDTLGRRLYNTEAELASALRVSNIVEVPVMDDLTRTTEADVDLDLLGIIVNLNDYTLGADKGGAVSMFDDFDIDYNQYKYLLETRVSGTLTKPKSALVIEQIVE